MLSYVVYTHFSMLSSQWMTKYISGSSRSISTMGSMIFTSILFLIIGWENFELIQLMGYLISNIGFWMYIELIILPFWNFNKYTSKY